MTTARRPRPGRAAISAPADRPRVGFGRATAIRSGPARRSPSAASRSPARRASRATPTATSCSTRSPTRCSGRPGWATSGGCSRPMRARRGGSPARELLAEVATTRRHRASVPRRVDVTIVAARPRLGAHLDAMRERSPSSSASTRARQREGVDRQSRRRRGRRPGNLGPRGRDRRASTRDDDPPPGHAVRGDPPARAARGRPRPDLQLRPDGLRPGPYRQLPELPLRGRPRPLPPLPGAAGHVGHEHHRHRRQDHPRCRRRRHRRSASSPTAGSSAFSPMPPLCG